MSAEAPASSPAPETMPPADLRRDIPWAFLIGIAGALAGWAFRQTDRLIHYLLTGYDLSLTRTAAALPLWERLLTPVAGGVLAGLVLHFGTRFYAGRKPQEYLEAVRVGDGTVPVRPSLVKTLASLCSIASGASIGREGPMVQLAALLGSLPGRALGFDIHQRRLLIACGAAAGIAAAYNAPLGGALFAAEIVLGSFLTTRLGPLLISSITATLTTRAIFGDQALFSSTPHTLDYGLLWRGELLAYVAVGLATGIAAPLFLHALDLSRAAFSRLKLPPYLALALGGLIVGLISLAEPRVWGNGYAVVDSILHDRWLPGALVLILVLKVTATAASVGSGAVGGVFTPSLFVGAAIGELIGIAMSSLFPGHTAAPAAYGLAGMAALLSATTHAPMMAILITFEMTLDYRLVLYVMIASVIAYYTSLSLHTTPVYGRT